MSQVAVWVVASIMAYSEVRMAAKTLICGPNPKFFADGAPEFLGHSLSLTLPYSRGIAYHSVSRCITVVLVSITVETAATNIPNPNLGALTVAISPSQSKRQ